MTFRRTLEITITRDEFFRLLQAVVPSFQVDGETARWSEAGRARTIRLVPLGDRTLGSMAVPSHHVEIVLEQCDPAEGEAFMARFRRGFLRGGG